MASEPRKRCERCLVREDSGNTCHKVRESEAA
ncbi:uncharacterized protein G2W53_030494 [Senna tora]|uniref:Uncharacterized protein n=1 Tax=Senna tora TaxID=362788 RepID=A0A834T7I9_9FABA|nr:uncharacterized protein G2W53_030494 [Senna tora]